MAIRVVVGDLPRVCDIGWSHRTRWVRDRQLHASPSVQVELMTWSVPEGAGESEEGPRPPGHSLPGSPMITWALERSGVDRRRACTTHLGKTSSWVALTAVLGQSDPPSQEDLLAQWLGVLSWNVLSCHLLWGFSTAECRLLSVMPFLQALFDIGVKGWLFLRTLVKHKYRKHAGVGQDGPGTSLCPVPMPSPSFRHLLVVSFLRAMSQGGLFAGIVQDRANLLRD